MTLCGQGWVAVSPLMATLLAHDAVVLFSSQLFQVFLILTPCNLLKFTQGTVSQVSAVCHRLSYFVFLLIVYKL